jgi:ABC-type glycerol-3-phosphate transport system substrate-binding protein
MTPLTSILVAAAVLLAGCGSAASSGTASASGTPSASVPLGSVVQLTVSADVEAEVHVHGVELHRDAAPNKPARITFRADRPGLLDVEAHPETLLLQLLVR